MKKNLIVLVSLLVVGAIFFSSRNPLETNPVDRDRNFSLSLPSFSLPSLDILSKNTDESSQAWIVLEKYLQSAQEHDLEGVRNLSHQLSPTCQDASKEAECFALMDNVVELTRGFEKKEFTNVLSDSKQIILYTDYVEFSNPDLDVRESVRTVIYFTKTTSGEPKVLGMRFCLMDESGGDKCLEPDPSKRDIDQNGWWDSVESLFY